MSHVLTEVATFDTPITVPDATDSGTTRAQDVARVVGQLANRTEYLKHAVENVVVPEVPTGDFAHKTESANTFTKAQTIQSTLHVTGSVDLDSALNVDSTGHFDGNIDSDASIHADVDVTATRDINATRNLNAGANVSGKMLHSDEDTVVDRDLTVSRNTALSGTLSVGTFDAHASTLLYGDALSSGSIGARAFVYADANGAGTAVAQPLRVIVAMPLAIGQTWARVQAPATQFGNPVEIQYLATDGTTDPQPLPLHIPIGVVVNKITFKHKQTTSVKARFRLVRREIDWDTTDSVPDWTEQIVTASIGGAVVQQTEMRPPDGDAAIALSADPITSGNYEWRLFWLPANAADILYAAQLDCSTIGPYSCP